jgi:hypothetical protein
MVQRPALVDFHGAMIKDICCGFNHCLVLSDRGEVFVWGRRMGVYDSIELSLQFLESRGHLYNKTEINQASPRLMKNNLIFYSVKRIVAGPYNSALITHDG